jgi:hypothetical protein
MFDGMVIVSVYRVIVSTTATTRIGALFDLRESVRR